METINDIVREVAGEMLNTSMQDITAKTIFGWATRLGDVVVAENATTSSTCKESRQVGNAAKMREALEKIIEIAKREWNAFRETSAMYEMHKICTAALAAPPRNCDKIHDVHGMSIAESPLDMSLVVAPRDELLRFIYWLFAEAKGANDEQ